MRSVHDIARMPEPEREALLATLVPERLLGMYGVDPRTFRNRKGRKCLRIGCPGTLPFFHVEFRRDPGDRDPVYFIDVSNSTFGQMEISFVIVNDPAGERFDVDVDARGRDTWFGTARRNIPEEIRAMAAGLSPGQVRRGLKVMGEAVECWDAFFDGIGHEVYFLEPLGYNSAILYERHGFGYIDGRERMERIDREFRPGGEIFARLDGTTPFRRREHAATVRGRAWAIHDGVLGESWKGPRMSRKVGVPAGVNTFTGEAF